MKRFHYQTRDEECLWNLELPLQVGRLVGDTNDGQTDPRCNSSDCYFADLRAPSVSAQRAPAETASLERLTAGDESRSEECSLAAAGWPALSPAERCGFIKPLLWR